MLIYRHTHKSFGETVEFKLYLLSLNFYFVIKESDFFIILQILHKLPCCRGKTLFPDEHISAPPIFSNADCESDFKICLLEKNIEQMKIYEIFTLRAPVF